MEEGSYFLGHDSSVFSMGSVHFISLEETPSDFNYLDWQVYIFGGSTKAFAVIQMGGW